MIEFWIRLAKRLIKGALRKRAEDEADRNAPLLDLEEEQREAEADARRHAKGARP
jgi:predicted kinase